MGPPRRARRDRRSPSRSGRSRAAARDNRRNSACARRGPRADATSAGRRLRRTGGRRSEQGARAAARLGVDQRHRVLQLVAETERAAGLVVAAARPEAARERLIEQPAVGQHVERRIGRFAPARRRACASSAPSPRRARHAAAADPRKRCTRPLASATLRPTPSLKTISRSWPSASSNGTWIAAHGSRPAPTLPESRARAIAAGLRSVPLRPRNSVRSPVTVRVASSASKNATRSAKLGVVGVAREDRAAAGFDLGDHVHRRLRPQVAQHPLDVAGRRKPARSGPSRCAPSAPRT